MIKRTLTALFGAFLCSILAPIAYYFVFDGFPLEGFKGFLAIIAAGTVFGAILGALFPRVFGFIFEMLLNS